MFRLTVEVTSLTRMSPTFDLICEENTTRWKWKVDNASLRYFQFITTDNAKTRGGGKVSDHCRCYHGLSQTMPVWVEITDDLLCTNGLKQDMPVWVPITDAPV